MRSLCYKIFAVSLGALILMSGCGSSQKKVVTKPSAASPSSYTDKTSRLLAQHSFDMRGQLTEDYRIGPGDLMEISIFEWELREETKTATFRVAESGIISLPVIGDVQAGGKTVKEVKNFIEYRLKTGGFLLQPRVSVDIQEYRSKRVGVVGAVNDPGVYTLRRNVTRLLDILSLAGGLSERGGYVCYVIRPLLGSETLRKSSGGTQGSYGGSAGSSGAVLPIVVRDVITIDLFELLELGNMELNMILRSGDVVNVPEAKSFSILGYVREPGVYPLKEPTTVLEGVSMARGLVLSKASTDSCFLKRNTPGGETIMQFDLVAMAKGSQANPYLMPDDILYVGPATGKIVAGGIFGLIKSVLNLGYWIGGRN